MKSFCSDNNSPVHPLVFDALSRANVEHAISYGDDPWTAEAENAVKSVFGEDVLPLFVYNGTGSNVLSLQLCVQSFNSIICASTAHIAVDECNAPGRFTGAMLVPVHTEDGKLTPDLIRPHLTGFGFEHHSQPGAVYISQCTELGTVYTPDEIREIADLVHSHGMKLHMDGARIANAAASLGLSLKEITVDCGVDVLSLGGTKNGLMFGECVVVFDKKMFPYARYFRKQSAQLASKMRYISAQFSAYLKNDLWLDNALHANAMAKLLADSLKVIPGIRLTQKVESNQIFLTMPREVSEKLLERYSFYYWNEAISEVRFVTSFDTEECDVTALVDSVKELLSDIDIIEK